MKWISRREFEEMQRQREEGGRLLARADWVKIARHAELRRIGLLPPKRQDLPSAPE